MAAIFRRLQPSLVAEGFFPDEDNEAAFIADLEHFEREPGNAALAWRHGIDGAVIRKDLRTRRFPTGSPTRCCPDGGGAGGARVQEDQAGPI